MNLQFNRNFLLFAIVIYSGFTAWSIYEYLGLGYVAQQPQAILYLITLLFLLLAYWRTGTRKQNPQ